MIHHKFSIMNFVRNIGAALLIFLFLFSPPQKSIVFLHEKVEITKREEFDQNSHLEWGYIVILVIIFLFFLRIFLKFSPVFSFSIKGIPSFL